jgi:rod shape determining protein RodA
LGKEIYGSKSWFQFAGIALQPGEFAKMATALALAKFLSRIEIDIRKRNDLVLALGIILLPAFLIFLEHDTGSALVFLAFIFVLYRAGLSEKLVIGLVLVPLLASSFPYWSINSLFWGTTLLLHSLFFPLIQSERSGTHLLISLVYLASAGFVFSVDFAVNHILEPHQRVRVNVLIGKDIDLQGAGYNVNQSLDSYRFGWRMG